MRWTLALFLILSFLPAYCKEIHPLTREILCNTPWVDYDFRTDGIYTGVVYGVDVFTVIGKYKLENGKLYMTPGSELFDLESDITNLEHEKFEDGNKGGVLIVDPDNLNYTRYISFTGKVDSWFQICDSNSFLPPGSSVSIQGIPCIKLDPDFAPTTTRVYLRSGPGTTYKPLSFYATYSNTFIDAGSEQCYALNNFSQTDSTEQWRMYQAGEADLVQYDLFPAEYSLYFLARTRKKYRVDNMEDYWYYVVPDTDIHFNHNGWVFGHFLDLPDHLK